MKLFSAKFYFFAIVLSLGGLDAIAQPSFDVIPLGVYGGGDESNLSSYMVTATGSRNYVCLDAGTLRAGIARAVKKGSLTGDPATILQHNVKGYLISHPHLDHLAGMLINAPDDSSKNIYALPFCIDVMKEKYFSWKSWANFADAGEAPLLKKYHYQLLLPGQEMALANTELAVRPFPLSHGNPYQSTAFLLRSGNNHLLYFGDTGADSIERSNDMNAVWTAVAPLIKSGRLKAIFIEVSFDNSQPAKSLFGHLTPALLFSELESLAALAGAAALRKVAIVITHQKPGNGREKNIPLQLKAGNSHHWRLVFPQQGEKLSL